MREEKEAVLLISFGTRYREAAEKSLDCICRDLARESKLAVYQAYTASSVIDRLAVQGIHMDTVEEAAERMLRDGIRQVYAVPSHMIPGQDFYRLKALLAGVRPSFERLETAGAVLESREDCQRTAALLQEILQPRPEWEYILMGHGSETEANICYKQMNEILRGMGMLNVRIAAGKAQPGLEDALREMRGPEQTALVVLQPFMVTAGAHALHDMAGAGDSFDARLRRQGYQTRAVLRGLGEYPQFRRIYLDRLKALMRE